MRHALFVLALIFSFTTLVMLQRSGGNSGLLAIGLISYLFWLLVWATGNTATGFKAPVSPSGYLRFDSGAQQDIGQYYHRLAIHLGIGWPRFQRDHGRVRHSLHSVDQALDRAIDLAQTTGLLAGNTLTTAAHSGETGRGFALASQKLMDISQQSGEDLTQLRRLTRSFLAELNHCQTLAETPLTHYVEAGSALPVAELVNLHAGTIRFQAELKRISDHYPRSRQADVRWLQVGDAVRRLVAQLADPLSRLELHLQDVLSDMYLLQMNQEGTRQMVEMKDRMPAHENAGG